MNNKLDKLENTIRIKERNGIDATSEMRDYTILALDEIDDSNTSLSDLPKAINYKVAIEKSKELFNVYKNSGSIDDLKKASEWNCSALNMLGICFEDDAISCDLYNKQLDKMGVAYEDSCMNKDMKEHINEFMSFIDECYDRYEICKGDETECSILSMHVNTLYIMLIVYIETYEKEKSGH